MLKQGGEFKVAGVKYKVELDERDDIDSKGERPKPQNPFRRNWLITFKIRRLGKLILF